MDPVSSASIASTYFDIEFVRPANPLGVSRKRLPERFDRIAVLAKLLVGERRVDLLVTGSTQRHRRAIGTLFGAKVVFLDDLWVVDSLVGDDTAAQFAGRRHWSIAKPIQAASV